MGMVAEVPPDLKSSGTFCHHLAVLMAFSATTFPFWWHFPPLWLFPSDLSGGTFCRHFAILTALSAPTFVFWRHFFPPHFFSSDLSGGHFSPPLLCFDGAFCPHTGFTYSVVSFAIASTSDITFSAISTPASGNSFVSGCISTSACSLITESSTAAS